MVDEDAEKAQRELTWKRYREMAQNLPALDGSVEEGDQKTNPVEILKDTLFKVLEEAEQLVSSCRREPRNGHSWESHLVE